MSTQPTTNTPKRLQEWLHLNKEFIEEIRNSELSDNDTQIFYEKLLESNIFGDKIIIRITKITPISNNQHKVIATVVQPSVTGYQSCPHPLYSHLVWQISTVTGNLSGLIVGDLYESTYTNETHRDKKSQLITFRVRSLKKINLTLTQRLQQLGGSHLAEVATEVYQDDLETVLFSKLFSFYEEKLKQDYSSLQERQQKLEIISQETDEKEAQLNAKIQELNLIEKDLQKSHKKEILLMNRQHQKNLDRLTKRERHLYDILSDIRQDVVEEKGQEHDETPIHPWDVKTNTMMMQKLFYHNSNQTLYYDLQIIEMFLRALQTNTLVILSGPSGTGKSSLINAFANALQESKASIIPVQSSWTDKQDLLGYFNTIEKRYVPTPFLEAILSARESSGLNLICLDEMNLSHIEYYFAELLSAREQDGCLDLYPARYRREALETIEEFNALEVPPSRDDKESYRNAIELLRFPARLEIPSNVRFVGTINMDHTVKPLSPKVIDRSFIVELAYQYPDTDKREELETNHVSGKIEFDLEKFSSDYLSIEDVISDTRWLVHLSDKLNLIPDAKINSRSESQIVKYLQVGPSSPENTLNQLVQSKFLPRIHFSSNNEEAMAVCESLLTDLRSKQLITSIKRFEKMRKGGRYISYFK